MQYNKAAVWKQKEHIILDEREYPKIAPNEVLVKVQFVGLCGSDLHFFQDGRIGSGILKEPRVLGHEASGYVTAVGSNVSHIKKGDPVVVDPGQSCGLCAFCQTGRYNLCERAEWDFLGTSRKDGALQQYLVHPANRVYKLPEGTSLMTGALLEPYSVASHGVNRIGMRGGGYTVILGCGCIGLMSVFAVKRRFSTKVIAVDIVSKRLDKARELGADHVIDSTSENLIESIMDCTNGKGADYVFETAGVPSTVELTAACARKGGKIVFVGTTVDTHVQVDFNAIMRKELDMSTVFRFAGELKSAVDELEAGTFSLESIVTHKFDFENVQDAFKNNIANKNDVVKTIVCL